MIEKPIDQGTAVGARLFHVSPEYLRQLADRMEVQAKEAPDRKNKIIYFFSNDIGFVYERDLSV